MEAEEALRCEVVLPKQSFLAFHEDKGCATNFVIGLDSLGHVFVV